MTTPLRNVPRCTSYMSATPSTNSSMRKRTGRTSRARARITTGIGRSTAIRRGWTVHQRRRALDADEIAALRPGDVYPGEASRVGGTFKISQKRGGVIERKTRGGSEFAAVEGTSTPALEDNARHVLDAWRQTLDRGITFHV